MNLSTSKPASLNFTNSMVFKYRCKCSFSVYVLRVFFSPRLFNLCFFAAFLHFYVILHLQILFGEITRTEVCFVSGFFVCFSFAPAHVPSLPLVAFSFSFQHHISFLLCEFYFPLLTKRATVSVNATWCPKYDVDWSENLWVSFKVELMFMLL